MEKIMTKNVNIRVDDEFLKQLKKVCEHNHITKSEAIRQGIAILYNQVSIAKKGK